jgi:hypothetical protein
MSTNPHDGSQPSVVLVHGGATADPERELGSRFYSDSGKRSEA